MDPKEWFSEYSFNKNVASSFRIKKVLHTQQSKYQKIEVLDTYPVGRLLLLDGKTMISEIDEFVYHEVMAHVSYMVSRSNKNVLIIGGGDGGIVREFARHRDIERIDLVEIDDQVVAVSKEFFPQCTISLDDPRVNIIPTDGAEYIKKHQNEYDIIILDTTDPENFAAGLFTEEFYKNVHNALTPEGIMMAQTENPFFDEYGIKQIYDNLKASFEIVQSLSAPMIIYPGVFWTFCFSSKKYHGTDLNPQKTLYMSDLEKKLKWYNQNWHKGTFALSNFHKSKLGL